MKMSDNLRLLDCYTTVVHGPHYQKLLRDQVYIVLVADSSPRPADPTGTCIAVLRISCKRFVSCPYADWLFSKAPVRSMSCCSRLQSCSSDISSQSYSPSHIQPAGMQRPVLPHWNWCSGHAAQSHWKQWTQYSAVQLKVCPVLTRRHADAIDATASTFLRMAILLLLSCHTTVWAGY